MTIIIIHVFKLYIHWLIPQVLAVMLSLLERKFAFRPEEGHRKKVNLCLKSTSCSLRAKAT